jgi:hypothetical protein
MRAHVIREALRNAAASGAVLLFATGAAWAEGEESRFEWHPSITVHNLWDDNPKLDDDGSQNTVGIWLYPRMELGYTAPSLDLGVDLGVDFRRYTEVQQLNDEFYRMSGHAEAGLLPGLSVRVSDDYVPEVKHLGLPEDQGTNMIQSNRSDAELRYWHELPLTTEIEVGTTGTYFLSESFAAELPNGVVDTSYKADYWQVAGFVQLQKDLGRRTSVFLLSEAGRRDFDDGQRSDHINSSVVVGVRSQRVRNLEFEASIGYGRIDFEDLSNQQAPIGEAKLTWRLPDGWATRIVGSNDFATNLGGNEVFQASGELSVEKEFAKNTTASVTGFIAHFDDDNLDGGSDLYGGVEVGVQHRFDAHTQVGVAYRRWDNGGDKGTNDFGQNRVTLDFSYRY